MIRGIASRSATTPATRPLRMSLLGSAPAYPSRSTGCTAAAGRSIRRMTLPAALWRVRSMSSFPRQVFRRPSTTSTERPRACGSNGQRRMPTPRLDQVAGSSAWRSRMTSSGMPGRMRSSDVTSWFTPRVDISGEAIRRETGWPRRAISASVTFAAKRIRKSARLCSSWNRSSRPAPMGVTTRTGRADSECPSRCAATRFFNCCLLQRSGAQRRAASVERWVDGSSDIRAVHRWRACCPPFSAGRGDWKLGTFHRPVPLPWTGDWLAKSRVNRPEWFWDQCGRFASFPFEDLDALFPSSHVTGTSDCGGQIGSALGIDRIIQLDRIDALTDVLEQPQLFPRRVFSGLHRLPNLVGRDKHAPGQGSRAHVTTGNNKAEVSDGSAYCRIGTAPKPYTGLVAGSFFACDWAIPYSPS